VALAVVKHIEDFEIERRDHYDQKRNSNAMYWAAFTLIMKRSVRRLYAAPSHWAIDNTPLS
jgi:hypothetical protein